MRCETSSALAEMGDRLAAIAMGLKVGGCCALFRGWGGELGPHLTMSPGLRSTIVPSGVLIHPAT